MNREPKYRTQMRIETGGVPRRVYGARRTAEQNGHALAVQQLTDIPATVPQGAQHWAYEVRRGRMTVYGGVLRFLDLLHKRGVPLQTALLIPRWIRSVRPRALVGSPERVRRSRHPQGGVRWTL